MPVKTQHFGRRWTAVGSFLWGVTLMLGLALPNEAGPPTIGTVTTNSPKTTIGRFQKFELTFQVGTVAANLYLPYDPDTPPYAANLKSDEDAKQGVSVDALFLPPGRKDWRSALVQPGFLCRDFVRTPWLPGEMRQTENLVPQGRDQWKVRFAPTEVGVWQYRLRVTDAGGTVLSAPKVVTCVCSDSPGFLRVSAKDSRYFEFDNGDAANLIGENLFFTGLPNCLKTLDSIGASGASAIHRLWIAGRNGQEVIGGFANSSGGRFWIFGPGTFLTTEDAHSGRFSVHVADGQELTTCEAPLKPNTAYSVTAWVKSIGATDFNVETQDSTTYKNDLVTPFSAQGMSGWRRVTIPWAAHNPQNGANFFGTVKFLPRGGSLLVDDVQVTEAATGTDALEVGDFERHVHYNQRQSWLLDRIVEESERTGQYLRLNCLENDDSVFCNVGADGASADHDSNNFFGQSADSNADLPARRFQRYYARYLVARWGYSTAVAQWEYNNEGALFNGNHYAGAQNFAAAIHAFSAEGHRLVSTSFWQNSSGTSYPHDFYDSGRYPDIDYADIHNYITAPGSSDIPFGAPAGGFVQLPDGGPDGLGALHLDGRTTQGQPQHMSFSLASICGRGTWTISYRIRADDSANLNWYGRGPDLDFWCDDLKLNAYTVPAGTGSPVLPPGYGWRACSRTFYVPDNLPHAAGLWAYASGLSGGAVDFSDVRVVAPDGRLWAHYTFNEPRMTNDSASLAGYLGLQYTSLSGDPSLGKPLTVGETDIPNPVGDSSPGLPMEQAGVYFRQFCWAHMNPSGATLFLWDTGNTVATDKGYWNYAAAYQRFMRDIPVNNGRYRNIEAKVSDLSLVVIGQKDVRDGRAHFFVYNRAGNWYNLACNPMGVKSVSGTVQVPGLPNGHYTVEIWDTSRGRISASATQTVTDGTLSVKIDRLYSDMAVKVCPTSRLRISVRHIRKSAKIAKNLYKYEQLVALLA